MATSAMVPAWTRLGQRRAEALGVVADEAPVEPAVRGEPGEQPVPQRRVGAGREREVQVGALARGGAARVDDDDADAAFRARELDALVEDRVAPRRVGAGEHDEVGEFEVVVALRTTSAPNARRWPATEEAMHSREFVSTCGVPMKPLASLLAT